MAFFINRERWRRQPSRPVSIDQTHPLARSLRFFFVFVGGVPIDLATWMIGTRNGSAAIQGSGIPAGGGTVAKLASASSDFYEFAHRAEWEILTEITLAWRGRINSGSAFRHFVGKHTGGGGTNCPYDFRTDNAASPKISLVRSSGATFSQFDSIGTIPLNAVATVEATKGADLGVTPTFYINGADAGSTTSGVSGTATGSAATLRIGRRADGAVQMDGFTEYVVGWGQILSADALREFRQAPYALLRPRETPVFYSLPPTGVVISAVTAFDITASAATPRYTIDFP